MQDSCSRKGEPWITKCYFVILDLIGDSAFTHDDFFVFLRIKNACDTLETRLHH